MLQRKINHRAPRNVAVCREIIQPVLLCGGSGTRLWPLSRPERPKQFLPLCGGEPLIVETARRVAGEGFAAPICLGAERHLNLIMQTMHAAGINPKSVILEPVARNTGPAAVVAACAALQNISAEDDPLVLLLPCDHHVDNGAGLRKTILAGAQAAHEGHIVTIGVEPSRPEPNYSYIQTSSKDKRGVHRVIGFVEKPDQTEAARFTASGQFFWNSGIFLFSARSFLAEAQRCAPEMMQAAQAAFVHARHGGGGDLLDRMHYQSAPARSIDTAIMEQTDRAVVLPARFEWCDLGSWTALRQYRQEEKQKQSASPVSLRPSTGIA